jgi:hypothetical protein
MGDGKTNPFPALGFTTLGQTNIITTMYAQMYVVVETKKNIPVRGLGD